MHHLFSVIDGTSVRGENEGVYFWPMGEEATGGWRKLHNEDLHNL